ncbi:GTPase HflX [Gammaproteobacteria bacterium 45_16_T64]|nr:GTPase HflX [Gammaproteobacteria bacterium 45_16_T64]
MFDRPQQGERAVLVHIDFPRQGSREDPEEFELLVDSAGAESISIVRGTRQQPDARYFIGSGKAEELADRVRSDEADLVIFNHILSPSQERNLEKLLECRVLDRTGLILDIFAQRARTFEGKLQVELAQLEHLSTRLIRGWTHLERQKGGIGLRGPGETQLETDRRLLRARIKAIHRRLNKVRKQRDQGRRSRRKAEVPTVSLVGYTNAGKSTLFNHLTTSDVYAADQLFATLDPTLRRLEVEDVGAVILADTVGFIRDLPHKLVEAFRATLEESKEADLLIHVVDACAEERGENIRHVNDVLKEIKADAVPRLLVYNKIDLMGEVEPRIDVNDEGEPQAVWLSAKTGVGTELLFEALRKRVGRRLVEGTACLTPDMGQLRALFHQLGVVEDERYDESGNTLLDIRLPEKEFQQALKKTNLTAQQIRIEVGESPDDVYTG